MLSPNPESKFLSLLVFKFKVADCWG